MRITFVINSLEGGGAERVLATVLQQWVALGDKDHVLDLVLLDDLPRKYPLPVGLPVRVLDARQSLWRSTWRLRGALHAQRPDLVISFLNRANFAAILVAKLMDLRVLVSERVNTSSHFSSMGWRGRMSKTLVRLLYPHADGVIAVSEGVAKDLEQNFGVAAQRLHVIHNPYDLAVLRHNAAATPEVTLPPNYIVGVGRLTRNKNFPLLLHAHALMPGDIHLVILGAGEQLQELQQLAGTLGSTQRVHFPGYLQNPHAVVARARAFVSSSDAEGFPNAAAEAMAVGTLVVMTDCPSGPAELLGGHAAPGQGVCTGRHGLLVPVGDRDALAAAIGRVLKQPEDEEMQTLRLRAMDFMSTLDAAQVVQRYINVARAS